MQELYQVLIIDDCEEDCSVYRRYLLAESKVSRYEITVTESAEEALALCERDPFDVILLDYELPECTGFEILEQFSSRIHSNAAIIMMTAHGNESLAVKALKQGAHDYLVKKSITADVLTNAIRSAITQVRLRKQLSQSQQRQELISRIALKIRDTLDLKTILETSVLEIRQLLQCDRVLILKHGDQDDKEIVAESIHSDRKSSEELVAAYSTEPLPLVSANAASFKQDPQSICVEDVSVSDLSKGMVKTLNSLGVVSFLEVPITIETSKTAPSKTWGVLVVHASQQRAWPSEEQLILQELCVHLAIAIQQSELLTQTQCALIKEKELNQFKSQIVATVSHEYRTPITSILASSATLQRHLERLDQAQNQRLLTLISQQARHLKELVDDMLVVNQVELGQIQFKPFPLHLEQFFNRLIEQYRVMSLETHSISLQVEDDVDSFIGDFGLCRQIFGNLLSNAIKYSPKGGSIKISVGLDDQDVVIRIRDQGIGIPNQDLPIICQSFTRGSNVDTITGTGLGLSIAQACIELHQGTLSIQSQKGTYTEAIVTLPQSPPTPLTSSFKQ